MPVNFYFSFARSPDFKPAMPIIILVCFLLIGNWLFSEVLIFSPLRILDFVDPLFSYGLIILILSLLTWFFKD